MKKLYFKIYNNLSRVYIDDNGDAEYCETFDIKSKKFIINNSILDDLFNHSDAVEIDKEEFDHKLLNLK